jgi:UDP-N-acetylmuramyl tripeptide synthase
MIDYAHNGMSLESLLKSIREYNPGRIVTLFGCGGNRDKARRYEMGEVSGKYSELSVITSDNPRNEEPQAIIDDIKIGIENCILKTENQISEAFSTNQSYVILHAKFLRSFFIDPDIKPTLAPIPIKPEITILSKIWAKGRKDI